MWYVLHALEDFGFKIRRHFSYSCFCLNHFTQIQLYASFISTYFNMATKESKAVPLNKKKRVPLRDVKTSVCNMQSDENKHDDSIPLKMATTISTVRLKIKDLE